MIKSLPIGVLSLILCGICSASTLYVSASGTFSLADPPDNFVTPGETFSLSFVVNSNPVTNSSNSTTLSLDVPVSNFSYDLNQHPVNIPQPGEITFYTSANGGGFAVQFATAEFIFGNSQIFSGTTVAPVVSAGTFASQTYTFLDSNNLDSGAATITAAATPEPSSVFLLLGGGVGLIVAARRKSFRIQ